MDDSISRKIQELIELLRVAQSSFQTGGTAFQNLANDIEKLNLALKDTSGIKNLQSLQKQVELFISAVKKGENIQIRLGDIGRFRTGQAAFGYQQTQPNVKIPTKDQLSQAIEPGTVLGESKGEERARKGEENARRLKQLQILQKEEQKIEAEYEAEEKTRLARFKAQEKQNNAEANKILQEKADAELAKYKAVEEAQQRALQEYIEIQQKVQDQFNAAAKAEPGFEDKTQKENQRRLETQEKQAQEDLKRRKAQEDANLKTEFEILNNRVKAQQQYQKMQEELARKQFTPQKLGMALPGGDYAAQAALKKVQAIDPRFTIDTLKNVTTESSNQMSRLSFAFETVGGATQVATVNVDRFGKVLVDNQRRFRDFGDNVIRDIVEVAKWSIAIAIVYGPMQKFSQLIADTVEVEAKLASVSVTLGNAQKSTNEIFQSAYEVAQQTGESVKGVIDAYNQAYRATGGAADETKRFADTQKLLTSSITLSKLAGISQTEAIDTLSASLRQAGYGLDQGDKLINKWIRTTRVANVDLYTLATGFATVADTADQAGLSFDQLNGIIALVAETSQFSGQEVANATKAIIASFQSDATKKQLDTMGIAYEDLAGKSRNFLEIAKQINDLSKQGIITPEQFSALTLAQGGGPRRQPIIQAFYSSIDKLNQVEKESQLAGEDTGEAQQALGRKLDNVATSTEKLSNAFIALGQALGNKGGLLDTASSLIKLLTGVVDIFAKISDFGGKAVPILIAMGAAMLVISKQTPVWRAAAGNFIANTAGNIAMAGGRFLGQTGNQLLDTRDTGRNFARGLNYNTVGMGAAVAIPALSNLFSGEKAKAAGDVIGGTIAGVLTKSPVGAAIGATIGEAFVTAIENFKPELSQLFRDIYIQANQPPTSPKEVTPATLRQEAATKGMELMGDNSQFKAQLAGVIMQTVYNVRGGLEDIWKSITTGRGTGFKGVNQDQTLMIALEQKRNLGNMSPEDLKKYDEMIDLLRRAVAMENPVVAPGNQAVNAQYGTAIKDMMDKYTLILQQRLASGQITTAGYRTGREQVGGLNVRAPQYLQAFGGNYPNTQEALSQFGRMAAFGSPETLAQLNTYAATINDLNEKLKVMSTTDKDYKTTLEAKNNALREATALINEMNIAIASQVQLLNQVDLTKYEPGDVSEIVKRAQQNTQAIFQANVKAGAITIEDAKTQSDNLEKILVQTKNGFIEVTGVLSGALGDAANQLKEEGKILEQSKLGFQGFDMSSQRFNELIGLQGNAPGYQKFVDQLTGLGYKEDRTEQIAILTDGAYKPAAKDWRLVEYYLSQILKVNEKQLEGLYNFPEGANAWLPYSAIKQFYGTPQPPGATGGMTGGVPTITTTTEEMRKQAQARIEYNAEERYNPVAEAFKSLKKEILSPPNLNPEPVRQPSPTQMPDRFFGYDKRQIGFEANLENPLETLLKTNPFEVLLDSFKLYLNNMFPKALVGDVGGGTGVGINQTVPNPLSGTAGAGVGTPIPSAKLSIDINSKATLLLDGRVVADSVKRYLYADLVRMSTSGTAVKASAI